jgi:hypothetical protein
MRGKTNGEGSQISRTVHPSSATPGWGDRGCSKILGPLKISAGSRRSCTSESKKPNTSIARAARFRARAEVLLTRTEQLLAPRKLATVHELRDQIGSLHQSLIGTGAGGKIFTRTDAFLKVHGWPLPCKAYAGTKNDDGEREARNPLTGRPPLQQRGVQSRSGFASSAGLLPRKRVPPRRVPSTPANECPAPQWASYRVLRSDRIPCGTPSTPFMVPI